jgi:hypothetical protein
VFSDGSVTLRRVNVGRPALSRCKVCGKPVAHRSELSKRGKCLPCATWLIEQNILGIAAHNGPFFQHWRRQMAASVGGRLLDDDASAA